MYQFIWLKSKWLRLEAEWDSSKLLHKYLTDELTIFSKKNLKLINPLIYTRDYIGKKIEEKFHMVNLFSLYIYHDGMFKLENIGR